MNLGDFKKHIESFPYRTEFKFGISEPFSWRGVYAEVAFSIIEAPMDKAEVIRRIKMAYENEFTGYKGGQYKYGDSTNVNFEGGYGQYTDGDYTAGVIARIEQKELYNSQEERLVKIAFA